MELYHKAALQGHANGILNLAHCMEHGLGVPSDAEGAFMWYEVGYNKTADQDRGQGGRNREGPGKGESKKQPVSIAAYHLARCYFRGIGTERDEGKAAAIMGHNVWDLGR